MASELDWKPIETAPHNKFVLVACRSGYVTAAALVVAEIERLERSETATDK